MSVCGENAAKSLNLSVRKFRNTTFFRFGGESYKSQGVADVHIPFGATQLPFTVHMIELDIPCLLGLDFLIAHKVTINYGLRTACISRTCVKLDVLDGHLYFPLETNATIYYTDIEVEKLHKRLGHGTAEKLDKLIQKANPLMADADRMKLKKQLKTAQETCVICQYMEPKPLRPSVAPDYPENVRFNAEVLDVFYLGSKPVLHMICADTRFSATCFLNDVSSASVVDAFIRTWTCALAGLPDMIRVDQGSSFVSMEFTTAITAFGITVKQSGVECHWSLGRGERYHAPIKILFEKRRRDDATSQASDKTTLALATRAVNESMGPEGFVPVFLVFGVLPRGMSEVELGSKSQYARMRAMRSARTEYESLVAKERLQRALSKNFPTEILMHPGDKVRAYRFDKRHWTGPHVLRNVNYEENVAYVEENGRLTKYSVAMVRPHREKLTDLQKNDSVFFVDPGTENTVAVQDAKNKELQGLKDRGVYQVVHSVPAGANIMRLKWVIKKKGEKVKARAVVLGHVDKEKDDLVRDAPVIQTVSIRLLIVAAQILGLELYSRDAIQAFLQSEWELIRDVYLIPPPEAVCGNNAFWKLVKPMYGTVDAPNHWVYTYLNALAELGAEKSLDPCFLKLKDGFLGIMVDDSLCAGGTEFQSTGASLMKRFDMHERQKLPFVFGGTALSKNGTDVELSQKEYWAKVESKVTSFQETRSARGKLGWLSNITRPDLSYIQGQLCQVTETNYDATRVDALIKKTRKQLCASTSLVFPRLGRDLELVVYSDASFGNNQDGSTQLGFVAVLRNRLKTDATVIHWKSHKSRRIMRSVLSAEVSALCEALDVGIFLKEQLRWMNLPAKHTIVTDSKSIFDTIMSNRVPTER
ncbi:Copia protein [Porphyridium purpureum]|uniref:Copia protein n=1 Tax=Porphyridium purpureum TaxID=35688 RepID=A0A5J4YRZ9_PORPP|nr:Copia protein [Porphyridium purpureum]|eukprot:POR8039..scf296_7